jgi:hypothetical protein
MKLPRGLPGLGDASARVLMLPAAMAISGGLYFLPRHLF